LKKLLTILLLILLAGQTAGQFHTNAHEVSFTQEADDKNEKGVKEKKDNEYIAHAFRSEAEFSVQAAFDFYSCMIGLSPVVPHLTPPPDVLF
jgi:hypothetical protein